MGVFGCCCGSNIPKSCAVRHDGRHVFWCLVMEWFTVPNLIQALIAVGVFAVRSELANIKEDLREVRAVADKAHSRIDQILVK